MFLLNCLWVFFSANYIRKKLADAATLTLSTSYWVYYQVFLVSPYPKRTLSQSYWIFTTLTCFQLLLGIWQLWYTAAFRNTAVVILLWAGLLWMRFTSSSYLFTFPLICTSSCKITFVTMIIQLKATHITYLNSINYGVL